VIKAYARHCNSCRGWNWHRNQEISRTYDDVGVALARRYVFVTGVGEQSDLLFAVDFAFNGKLFL
jgi:hypothetical protein